MSDAIINGKFLSQKITGVQRFAGEISKRLPFNIITPPNNKNNKFYHLNNNLKYVGTNGGVLWEQFLLPKFIKKNYPNALLINLCNTAPILNKNKISCIHDVAFLKHPQYFSNAFTYYYSFIIPLVIKSSKHIITVSDFSRQQLIDSYEIPENNISVISNGCSLFEQQNKVYSNPHPKPYFLFIGSLDPRKKLLFLLDAFKKANIKDYDLVCIGNFHKSFNKKFIEAIQVFTADKRIHFLQDINDETLISYYKHARALINPSVYEGFGLPLIEALSLKCPVIASEIPVFKEVGLDHIDYFKSEDKMELIYFLKYYSKQDCRVIDDTIATEIKERFSWNKSANKLNKLIEDLS